MPILTHIFIYAFVWWILFFMALPFGVRRVETPEEGHSAGAPEKTYLWRKIIIVSVLAIPVTFAVEYGMQDLLDHLRATTR